MFAELFIMAHVAHDNSVEAPVYDIVVVGCTIGPRAIEYAQTTQTHM